MAIPIAGVSSTQTSGSDPKVRRRPREGGHRGPPLRWGSAAETVGEVVPGLAAPPVPVVGDVAAPDVAAVGDAFGFEDVAQELRFFDAALFPRTLAADHRQEALALHPLEGFAVHVADVGDGVVVVDVEARGAAGEVGGLVTPGEAEGVGEDLGIFEGEVRGVHGAEAAARGGEADRLGIAVAADGRHHVVEDEPLVGRVGLHADGEGLGFVGPGLGDVALRAVELETAPFDQRGEGLDHALDIPLVGKTRGRRENQQGCSEVSETPDVHSPAHGRALDQLVSPLHRFLVKMRDLNGKTVCLTR